MKQITYSAPGKVILSGEHAVVYGKPALLTALDIRLTVSVWESVRHQHDDTIDFISEKVKEYLQKQNIPIKKRPYSFIIDSQIPIGSGLGSSAALAVASSAAFLEFYTGKQYPKETINTVAYQIEKKFHKNPSGADPSTCCYGGLVFYRKEFEFLKTISSLNCKIPKNIEERLILIDSGRPLETTGDMVQMVGKRYNKDSKQTDTLLCDIEKTTKRIVVSLLKEDSVFFEQNLKENERLLGALGVVSKKTQLLLKQLSRFGCGKITGAGGIKKGSGFILFYATKKNELEKYLRTKKINYIAFKQSKEGVRRE